MPMIIKAIILQNGETIKVKQVGARPQKFNPVKFQIHNSCMQYVVGNLSTKILSNVFKQNLAIKIFTL